MRITEIHEVFGRSLRGNVDRNDHDNGQNKAYFVVPYVGTWIEMIHRHGTQQLEQGRSLRGNVDRNTDEDFKKAQQVNSRSLRGNVDRNKNKEYKHKRVKCRSLRGNVDRNRSGRVRQHGSGEVVPYVGTWIEMRHSISATRNLMKSFPTWERG